MIRPYQWHGDKLELIDQRKLPHQEIWISCANAREVAAAIKSMVVRGAPAIGVAAAYGLALEARAAAGAHADAGPFLEQLEQAAEVLAQSRPTAVNLFWAIDRMRALWREAAGATPQELARQIAALAEKMDAEDLECNRAIGRHGAPLLAGARAVITHCNTGGLATSGYGTALGVIRTAHATKPLHVYACETRPYLQGARLTAWELQQDQIPVTLIVDSAAALLMKSGRVQVVITGADRIAANGDTANKIGTYGLAVLAQRHGIPFYVAAPKSTIDLSIKTGDSIKIEFRDGKEVTHLQDQPIAPAGVAAWNPSFDVTPADLITAIITEAGVARPPYETSLEQLVKSSPGGATDA